MGAVVLISAAMGLSIYGIMLALPRLSPRQSLVLRLRPAPAAAVGAPAHHRWRLYLAVAGLFLAALPWLLANRPVAWQAAIGYPLVLGALPGLWGRLQARRRLALLALQFPDLLAHLGAQTQAGAGTLQAFATAPQVLPQPLCIEVEELLADLSVSPFPAALQRFADRCAIPEVRDFVGQVIFQQSLGIGLTEVLADQEAHALAMTRQLRRQRIQRAAVAMAAVTVVLLINGLFIYLLPLVDDLYRLADQP